MNYLLVALGGALGAVARYVLGTSVQAWSKSSNFPFGTLTVNMIGCLLIGLLMGLAQYKGLPGSYGRLFLVVGILGGFTTFSSFGFETCELLKDGQFFLGLANACAQVCIGIALVWLGSLLSRLI